MKWVNKFGQLNYYKSIDCSIGVVLKKYTREKRDFIIVIHVILETRQNFYIVFEMCQNFVSFVFFFGELMPVVHEKKKKQNKAYRFMRSFYMIMIWQWIWEILDEICNGDDTKKPNFFKIEDKWRYRSSETQFNAFYAITNRI